MYQVNVIVSFLYIVLLALFIIGSVPMNVMAILFPFLSIKRNSKSMFVVGCVFYGMESAFDFLYILLSILIINQDFFEFTVVGVMFLIATLLIMTVRHTLFIIAAVKKAKAGKKVHA